MPFPSSKFQLRMILNSRFDREVSKNFNRESLIWCKIKIGILLMLFTTHSYHYPQLVLVTMFREMNHQ